MHPRPTEHTPSGIPRDAATNEEEEQNEQELAMESLSNPVAGTVVAAVQQEPTSEGDADVRLNEMAVPKTN